MAETLVDTLCLRCRALDLLEDCSDALIGHARRVTMLALLVADDLRAAAGVRRDVELGGLLHDIGKLRIPDSILGKPGPLDPGETEVMRTHVTEGERLAAELDELPASVPAVVRSSHERWDGGGYPDGLAGDDIPLAARIVSAADAFDAMTSSRTYRTAALSFELAVDILRDESGRQFDPAVTDSLLRTVERWHVELAQEPIATAFEETLRHLRRSERFERGEAEHRQPH